MPEVVQMFGREYVSVANGELRQIGGMHIDDDGAVSVVQRDGTFAVDILRTAEFRHATGFVPFWRRGGLRHLTPDGANGPED